MTSSDRFLPFVLLVFMVFVFCTLLTPAPEAAAAYTATQIEFRAFYPIPNEEDRSGTHEPICAIIRSGKEWRDLWKKMDFLNWRSVSPPKIDFDTYSLIAITLGRFGSTAHHAVIKDVVDNGDSVTVWACHLIYSAAPADESQPAVFALVPRIEKPVSFRMATAQMVRGYGKGCPESPELWKPLR